MANIEISAVLKEDGKMLDWATNVNMNNEIGVELSETDKEISNAIDKFAEHITSSGDGNKELSSLFRKVITTEEVEAPTDLVSRLFDTDEIDEFDNAEFEIEGENTYKVYDAVEGGNVDRSFIDDSLIKPEWTALQAETDISFKKIRRNGSGEIAKAIKLMKNQLELSKILSATTAIDNILTGGDQVINATGSLPTEAEVDQLNLYLMNHADDGDKFIFALNQYIQVISKMPAAGYYASDRVKDQYMTNGLLSMYAGTDMYGFADNKKKFGGKLLIPNKRVFGASGKIGSAVVRGSDLVWDQNDINSEKVHIKVRGASFGHIITKPENLCKIVLS